MIEASCQYCSVIAVAYLGHCMKSQHAVHCILQWLVQSMSAIDRFL